MSPVAWQSPTARGIAQRLWMRASSRVQTLDGLKLGSSVSDDEDDRASHSTTSRSTNVGGGSGEACSTGRGSISSAQSHSGSERSSPTASASFPPSGSERSSPTASASFPPSACDALSYSESRSASSRGSSPSRLPGQIANSDEDLRDVQASSREARQRRRSLQLRSSAKTLAAGAEYDYGLLRATFGAADVDNSGWVSPAALEAVFVRFGLTPDVALQVVQLLERDSKGRVNYVSFMARCGPLLGACVRSDEPRFGAPSPPPRGWRTWQRRPSVQGQSWYLC